MGEWDEVRGELGRVREEYEGLVRQLAEAERKLQVALQQRDQLEEQVRVCLTALLTASLVRSLSLLNIAPSLQYWSVPHVRNHVITCPFMANVTES